MYGAHVLKSRRAPYIKLYALLMVKSVRQEMSLGLFMTGLIRDVRVV